MDKGGQKVHTFSYEISKFWDVTYKMTIVNNAVLYISKLPRE